MDGWYGRIFRGCGFFDPDKPIRKFTKKELDDLLYKEPTKIKVDGINLTYEGLIPKIQKSMLSKDVDAMQPHIRAFVERAVTFTTCPDCGGTRLNEAARSSKIKGINIADACAMQISDLAEWVRGLDEPSVAPLLDALRQTLDSFVEIGLGYLSLDRPSGTLSGGEAQRTKMIRHLGSSLTDVTYVFDEPTIGLHPHDIQRMNDLLLRLRDKGNTVLVVEHKPETIAIADHVVDLGPGAGTAGGEVVFEGTVDGLRASGTLTGRHLDDRASLKPSVRTPSGVLEVRGASTHNLQDVDVDIPLGVLVVVTGVAGSGKSSLIDGSVSGRDGVVSVDQAAIKGSRRSNPATYTGLLDPIRKAFAKANGVKPALFSANSEGACPNCNGAGVIYTDLAMMAGVATTCEECEGKRFQAEVLEYTFGGKDISEVLAMSVDRGRGVLRRRRGAARRPRTRSSTGSPTSGSATSASASRSPRCPAASGSGSSWPPTWPRRATSTSSTSRPPASTSPTSSSCSACSTGSSTPASRSSSSSTTRRSWRTPTGSSTSAPAPATTAAGSSSRAPPPTSSPPAPPSPASTSRPTSAPDRPAEAPRDISGGDPSLPSTGKSLDITVLVVVAYLDRTGTGATSPTTGGSRPCLHVTLPHLPVAPRALRSSAPVGSRRVFVDRGSLLLIVSNPEDPCPTTEIHPTGSSPSRTPTPTSVC